MRFIDGAYGLTDLQDLTLDELAASIVVRLTRKDSEEDEPVWDADLQLVYLNASA